MWKRVDRLFPTKDAIKQILFVLIREGLDRFVRVVRGDKGFVNKTVKKFYIPLGYSYKVLRCGIIFT